MLTFKVIYSFSINPFRNEKVIYTLSITNYC